MVAPQESGSFLVQFEAPPSAEFLVRVMGRRDGVATKTLANFQRVTSTSFRSSNLTITVSAVRHDRPPLPTCSCSANAASPVPSRPIPVAS